MPMTKFMKWLQFCLKLIPVKHVDKRPMIVWNIEICIVIVREGQILQI